MQRWNLLELDAPDGTRDPIVLHSDDGARAVLIVLQAGQSLGEHQVKENAWITVLDGTSPDHRRRRDSRLCEPQFWCGSSPTSVTRCAATAARGS